MNRKMLLALAIVLVCALIGSIGLNVYLYLHAKAYYYQLNSLRLDPLGLSTYPKQDEQPVTKTDHRKRVVFMGDSRASMWPEPAELSEFEFINRGIGTQTTAQILARYNQHVQPLRPEVVVFQMGINDLKIIPIFPEQEKQIINNCETNIRAVVDTARQQDTVVILTTIFPEGESPLERGLFWSGDVRGSAQEVNAFIKSLADDQVLILDAWSLLANDQGQVKNEYSKDLLHLSPAGYDVLNAELKNHLLSLAGDPR